MSFLGPISLGIFCCPVPKTLHSAETPLAKTPCFSFLKDSEPPGFRFFPIHNVDIKICKRNSKGISILFHERV